MNQQKPAMLSPGKKFRGKIALLFQNNTGIIIRFTLTGLFIGLAVWFFNHERTELRSVGHVLFSANPAWITAGLGLLILYIFLQGCMYVTSFASVDAKLNPWDATILFLKRNFVSVFIPAGGISSLAFFSSSVEKKGISRSQVYFASSIYAFVGILSVIIVAIPAFIFAVSGNGSKNTRWFALIGAILILVLIYFIYKSIITKKSLYRFIIKIYPRSEVFFDEISTNAIIPRYFLFTVIISVFIEFVGIAHVYVSMAALNLAPSLSIAIIAYIVVVLFLIISPFLRGLGAIEVSMSYLLIRSGFNNVEAISITLLFRFFEFWMPLFAGLLSFLIKIEKIILRILPSLLIFTLGIINIVSVLSPGAPEKLRVLRDYLFFDVVNFSNSFVMITGLFLLVTAAFMIKGLRMAWWFAIVLSFFSAVGHITKGINYVETIMALLVVFALLSTRKEYYVKSNPRVRSIGIQTALLTVAAIMVYGIIGFYFLDKKHFLIDFSIYQSVKYTLLNFILVGSKNLVPHDPFSLNFLYTIKIAGAASMVFLVYSLVRPFVFQNAPTPEEAEKASALLKAYGRSSLDYFKSYPDKQIFLTSDEVSFVSFKVSRNFAVVLEDPVSAGTEEMKKTIIEFRKFCYDNGLRDIYYRVPKNSLEVYRQVSRKALFIGQEGIIDLSAFTLEGGDRKSIRNAINKITEQGYTSHIHYPPIKDGLIQKLKAVSDEWLRSTERKEIVFSQGMFDEKEIKQQVILTVENHEEKIIAFLNIIPDFAKDEGTYDLLRKTQDAPNGIIDFILTELFKYFQSIGIRYVNLGFAPMSGLDDPQNFPEKSMKFAYERIRSFTHFKGQREYKEKFNPAWYDKYLIYDFDYDLISIPSILSRVIKP